MFSRARISLGFSAVGDTARARHPIRQVRLRDFEVPMSGGFYMVEYLEEIEQFFVPDEEIVCFRDCDELVDKCRYYLANDAERRRIAEAGRRRALADHTWQKRLSDAFLEMALDLV
jgi:spore maturation protein CgeB